MSIMWQDSYQLVYKNHHKTRAGEITETGFGYFTGILETTKVGLYTYLGIGT